MTRNRRGRLARASRWRNGTQPAPPIRLRHMRRETIFLRVGEPLKNEWSKFCEAHDLDQSAAGRRLLQWFLSQDPVLQAMILSNVRDRAEVREMLVKVLSRKPRRRRKWLRRERGGSFRWRHRNDRPASPAPTAEATPKVAGRDARCRPSHCDPPHLPPIDATDIPDATHSKKLWLLGRGGYYLPSLPPLGDGRPSGRRASEL